MKILPIYIVLIANLLVPAAIFAQAPTDAPSTTITYPVVIKDKSIQDGDIISSTPQGYIKSKTPYDANIFGVIISNAAVSFFEPKDQSKKQVATFGEVKVKVTTANGPIKVNDFITSSEIAGVGQKSTTNGQILGAALESYNSSNPKAVGKIMVALKISYNGSFAAVRSNIFGLLEGAAFAATIAPLSALRYILAAIVTIASFVLGFVYFGKVTARGVEAMGRNPLASKMIQGTVIFNVFLTILIVVAGIGIAYLLLIL